MNNTAGAQIAQSSLEQCKDEIRRMLKNSQTKVIMPVITLAILRAFQDSQQLVYSDTDIERLYHGEVKSLIKILGHDVHIGGKYYDAYGSRMSRYRVLQPVGHLRYELQSAYSSTASVLIEWIPTVIKEHIVKKLGMVPLLGGVEARFEIASTLTAFTALIEQQISLNPANFEVFSFAILRVHLERFACKLYRDTSTAAHDHGVDLSTNFGVVYQVKKLRLQTQAKAEEVLAELKMNFDQARFTDGNVILVIDEIAKNVRQFLINMKVQSISKQDILKLAGNFEEEEDRMKVLRIVYEEFRREYSSRIS
jgi:hypothetical protein